MSLYTASNHGCRQSPCRRWAVGKLLYYECQARSESRSCGWRGRTKGSGCEETDDTSWGLLWEMAATRRGRTPGEERVHGDPASSTADTGHWRSALGTRSSPWSKLLTDSCGHLVFPPLGSLRTGTLSRRTRHCNLLRLVHCLALGMMPDKHQFDE